jgi:hypothetical protein
MVVHMIDEGCVRRSLIRRERPLWIAWCDSLSDTEFSFVELHRRDQRTLIRSKVTCPACRKMLKLKLPR